MASLIIGQLFASGALRRHLKEVLIPTYRTRHYSMVAAVRQYLYPLGVRIVTDLSATPQTEPAGGFFLYVLFPEDGSLPSIETIHGVALERFNLRIAPGALFTVGDDTSTRKPRSTTYVSGARLCWAWHEEDELIEGIERLAEALKLARKMNCSKSN